MIEVFQEWLHLIAAGTHDWDMFITPEELGVSLARAGLELRDLSGLGPRLDPFGLGRALLRRATRRMDHDDALALVGPTPLQSLLYMGWATATRRGGRGATSVSHPSQRGRRHRSRDEFFQRGDWPQALAKQGVSAVTQQIIEGFKTSIDALQQSEAALTRQLVAIADERITRLESIPSLGALSARVVLGALDDAHRFDNKKCAAKYGALSPSIYQSGETTQLGRISRDGRHEVRRVLLQCAHTLARMKSAGARPLSCIL